jgi:hypothetical protein
MSGVMCASLCRLAVGRRLLPPGALAGTSAPGERQDDRQDKHKESRQTQEESDMDGFNHDLLSIMRRLLRRAAGVQASDA